MEGKHEWERSPYGNDRLMGAVTQRSDKDAISRLQLFLFTTSDRQGEGKRWEWRGRGKLFIGRETDAFRWKTLFITVRERQENEWR